jgi:indolepyruvate ferredoxin oxidoreductase beta subunit
MTAHTSAAGKPGWRIVFAGTGGQGVITAARLLTEFFAERGNHVVSGQLHGMAQRGGAVQASVMIDCGISPVIPAGSADCVVGFEPVETARALPFCSSKTTVFMNTTPVVPYVIAQQVARGQGDGSYPDRHALEALIRDVTPHVFAFDATAVARSAGSVKTLNIVMVGCLLGSGILPATAEEFAAIVLRTAPSRLAESNECAFVRGVEYGKELCCVEGTH